MLKYLTVNMRNVKLKLINVLNNETEMFIYVSIKCDFAEDSFTFKSFRTFQFSAIIFYIFLLYSFKLKSINLYCLQMKT